MYNVLFYVTFAGWSVCGCNTRQAQDKWQGKLHLQESQSCFWKVSLFLTLWICGSTRDVIKLNRVLFYGFIWHLFCRRFKFHTFIIMPPSCQLSSTSAPPISQLPTNQELENSSCEYDLSKNNVKKCMLCLSAFSNLLN